MDFDFSPLIDSWRFLASGLGLTIVLSVTAVACSFVLGLAVGLGRMYGRTWLRTLLVFYIDSMRAIPVFVVLVWIYFAVPIISGYSFDPFWAALTGITIHVAAYVAEVIRAGITSIRKGQVQAGLAIGMSGAQIIRQILLPQAIVRMLPAFGSIVSVTIKDTAIAAVIAVPELMRQAETVAGQSYRPIEVFTTVMVIYFLLIFPITRLIDRYYIRVAHLGRS
ncbi:MAG: amino acid ABC transporter permease [Bradyrhizobium sp.]|jgi:polar amino acid transport system permease protein|uniref:amino acid ABC transporter permease n=1 Tax=Bradyrhizobium sp. TaxID=376 RepID=UPI0012271897|nr:amino acid ABC transporter permease [Bradyrhizobium sp.]THD57689.1 MAG: amino acid ABC transporter permease [Bradyrhizobium sp.]